MATVDLVKALIAKYSSFKLKGTRLAIMTPFNHVARGISLQPSIRRSDICYASWFFFFPARPFEAVDLGNGRRIGGNNMVWNVTSEAAIGNAIATIEVEAMPKLIQSSSPEGALELLLQEPVSARVARWHEECAYAFAILGRWQEALSALDNMKAAARGGQYGWEIEMRSKAEQLRGAIRSGADAVRILISANERYSLEGCQLAKLLLDEA